MAKIKYTISISVPLNHVECPLLVTSEAVRAAPIKGV